MASSLKEEVLSLDEKINKQETHINGIEQYIRVNNLEIIGIPPAEQDGAPIVDTLLEIFNALPDLQTPVTENDIDISHIMPSDRKDGKLVTVCRFKSRKVKFKIIEAKKKTRKTMTFSSMITSAHSTGIYSSSLLVKRGRLATNFYDQEMVMSL